ncbi:hypothetical protein [Flavobacterium sp. NRK F7]|uniref:hypothetical protein n=1 Tax=Flavobacterium sp. NRK F7 TaxID=2954930 RepID=UPI00209079E7|nr:hypothetical protein [Flavobacterium sp. NRK F7]MCO6161762.1 hypothetical protein [Flavobacterium sp. NRK F7]
MKNKFIIVDFSFAILLIVYFFYSFFRVTSDIPINDDYAVLENFTDIINSNSSFEKIKLIFKQHNEHRILYDKLWFFIDYKLFNQLNFNHLSFIGNLSLVGIFIFFFYKFKNKTTNSFFLLPVAVLIFNFSFYENITFSMAALSNFTVVLFSLLSIHFITKFELNKRDFGLSVLFLILAIFTQGAGIFLILITISILIYKKEKKYLYQLLIISFALILLYFFDYHKPFNSPEILETLRNYKFRSFLFSFSFLGNILSKYLIFTNDTNESLMLSTGVGFLFFIFYIYTIKIKYYKKNLFVFSVMTLIILISFVTGVTRSQLGIDMSIASRYRINSSIFLICVLIFFNENVSRKKKYLNGILLLCSVGYYFGINLPQREYLEFRKKQNYFGVMFYQNGNYNYLNGFEQEYYDKVLVKAKESQTYFLPTINKVNNELKFSKRVEINPDSYQNKSIMSNIDKIEKLKNSIYIEGWAFIDSLETNDQKVFLAVEDTIQKKKIFFEAQKVKRYDLNPYFNKNNLEYSGFIFRIKDEDLPNAYKKLYLLIENNSIKRIINPNKLIK